MEIYLCVLIIALLMLQEWLRPGPRPADIQAIRYCFLKHTGFWPVPGPIECHKGGGTPKPPKQEPIKLPKMEPIHIPPAPEPPPPPPPPPTQSAAEVQQAEDQARMQMKRRKGYQSTLLAGESSVSSATGQGSKLG